MNDIKSRFIGEYDLVSMETLTRNGEWVDRNYIGRLSYDVHGNMTGLGMPRDLPQRPADQSGKIRGFAYWGKVRFDPANDCVIHRVQGSPTHPHWVGDDQHRYFEFTGDGGLKLTMRNAQGQDVGILTWRRL